MTIGTVASHLRYEIGLGEVSKQLLSLPLLPHLPQNFSKSELVGVSKLFQRNFFLFAEQCKFVQHQK